MLAIQEWPVVSRLRGFFGVGNRCVETYENMTNVRNDVWWSQNTRLVQRKTKRTILGRVNFAPRVGPLRNCHG